MGELVVAPFSLLPFAWFALAATVLAATLTPTRGRAAALMTAGAFVAYALNLTASLVTSLDWLRFLTPYYYADAQRVLTEGTVWWHQAALLVAALACAALALAVFERREIGVGRSPLAALLGREPSAEEPVEAAREPLGRPLGVRARSQTRTAGARTACCQSREASPHKVMGVTWV